LRVGYSIGTIDYKMQMSSSTQQNVGGRFCITTYNFTAHAAVIT